MAHLSATYDSSIDLALGHLPLVDEANDPILYQELLDLHNAIENLLKGTDVARDFFHEIDAGRLAGFSTIVKHGENPSIPNAVGTFLPIWDQGGNYVAPTAPRLHNIVSTSAFDAGTLQESGTADVGSNLTTLIDAAATFSTSGVTPGDLVINSTTMEIGIVSAVVSETELAIANKMRTGNEDLIGTAIAVGDLYEIVGNASTGASVMLIIGLDADWFDESEFVILNGLNPVPTTKTFIRQFRAKVYGANTTGAAGTVTSTAQVDGTISVQIIDGTNQSLMAIYTVPRNKRGFLHHWWGSMSKKITAVSTLRLRVGDINGISYIVQPRSISSAASSEFAYESGGSIKLGPGVDIFVEADSNANDTGVSSGFDLVLEDI